MFAGGANSPPYLMYSMKAADGSLFAVGGALPFGFSSLLGFPPLAVLPGGAVIVLLGGERDASGGADVELLPDTGVSAGLPLASSAFTWSCTHMPWEAGARGHPRTLGPGVLCIACSRIGHTDISTCVTISYF